MIYAKALLNIHYGTFRLLFHSQFLEGYQSPLPLPLIILKSCSLFSGPSQLRPGIFTFGNLQQSFSPVLLTLTNCFSIQILIYVYLAADILFFLVSLRFNITSRDYGLFSKA